MKKVFLILSTLWLASGLLARAEPDEISVSLASLPSHPRLLARDADWTRLRARLAQEPALADFHAGLIEAARARVAAPPVTRQMVGRRLLHTSRELLHRVLIFSYAARTLDDPAAAEFAARVEQEMLAAARFEDWNPSHFLDIGEATAALALGYDWLHDRLTPAGRAEIAAAIRAKGLQPGLDPNDRRNSWHRSKHNWNQVCFGGLTLGALAIAEDAPDESATLLRLARAGIANGLAPYAPAGVYPEGPSYWAYGTTYQVLMIAALESALGTDWNLSRSPGLLPSAGAVVQLTGPTGLSYNFFDGGEKRSLEPATFWFAQRLDDPGLLLFELRDFATAKSRARAIAANRFAPLAALWWPERTAPAPQLPLDWHGDGANAVATFRESWTSPDAAYLAVKAGKAGLNHGHMDAGSFIYEADGVRWAIDLGMQDYESLESKRIDLWRMAQDSQRWTVFRLNNFSHNTLTLDGALHDVGGQATFTRFASGARFRGAVLDLSPVFAGHAHRVARGFALQPDRGFLVRDEISGLAPSGTARWQIATRARIELRGSTAILHQNNRTLTVRILAPSDATFVAAPAAPPTDGYNAPNPGVSLLSVTLTADASAPDLALAIHFTPGIEAPAQPHLRPLADW
jgi:hypothetical protein